ncbi:MAG: tetratricopeptide repeat protein, partial [Pseudomonadales bacterium]|nr:tetratricopeptide repeat protein [Pseudomonadales bacterium]
MGVARNDPCPCGSGRKYKQCCINRQQSMPSVPRPSMQQLLESAMRHFNAGHWREAEAACQQVLSVQPKQADALFVMGGIALKLGHYAEAEKWLGQAQRQTPQCPAALWHALAIAEHAQGKLDLAERHYREALLLDNSLHEAYLNVGTILQMHDQLEEAEDCYRRCLALAPDQADAHVNLGVALMQRHHMQSALHHLQEAIRLRPMYATAHRNLGLVYMGQGHLHEAEACFRQSLQLNADDSVSVSNLLFSLNYRDDLTPEEKLKEACLGGEALAAMAQQRGAPSFTAWKVSAAPERLRVGLLSGDYCQHPVAYFLESTLAHVDRSSLELIAYDTFPKDDAVSRRLKPMFSSWVSLHDMSDAQAAQRLYQDGLHILIDLSGHTAHNRLPLLTCRPAPLQIAWLGYFATTGLPGLDYILVDEHVVPPAEAVQFSEQCIWMPDTYRCFTPPDVAVDVNQLPSGSGHPVTFGCFNNLSKINERVVRVWSSILERLP